MGSTSMHAEFYRFSGKRMPFQIGKTNDQLYHLLAICLTDIDEFRVAFQQGCPKFLSPTTVVYEGLNQAKEPLIRQCNAFLEGIESQIMLPILRGYLKLYTTLPTKKLASFMDVADREEA
uniref:Uncharacterized protein n=1 Tax=Parascaris equorum TaxID=6256 RepID=A0A914RXB7_PAREQ